MAIERKDIIENFLYSEGFLVRPDTLGLLITQRREKRKNPMADKSREVVTVRDGSDMVLGPICTQERDLTNRVEWAEGKESKEMEDKFNEDNGIC